MSERERDQDVPDDVDDQLEDADDQPGESKVWPPRNIETK